MFESLQDSLGLHFLDETLLKLALTHKSYVFETSNNALHSNERLEFLGDSVLACISTDYLYRNFPELSEGDLSNIRSMLVKGETLAQFARDLHLGDFLMMSKGETNNVKSQRVLAATFEAVLGAIYLDQGFDAAQRFLLPHLKPMTYAIVRKRLFKDHKSRFQELAQEHTGITPAYRVVSQEGPSHDREFAVEVMLGDEAAGRGHGRNKQLAEQEAARAALRNRGWIDESD
jgi:ribonuclease III